MLDVVLSGWAVVFKVAFSWPAVTSSVVSSEKAVTGVVSRRVVVFAGVVLWRL